ncbi:MAG TPA: outer membrane protein assembly factor BamE [Xanthomonadaceae bacterium]|nr:outer membrane protein assembly factor BamE [Xanthomonadaceae bacterium]
MRKIATTLLSALLVAGCGAVYKVDVHQGSLLEAADVEKLEPGMSKRQVELLLGTPSVRDPFHQDRWDYVATASRRGSETEVKNLTLYFENDVLQRFEGDYFEEQDEQLMREMRRYGNLPRDKDKRRGG